MTIHLFFCRPPICVYARKLPEMEDYHPIPTEFDQMTMTVGKVLEAAYRIKAHQYIGDPISIESDKDLNKLVQDHYEHHSNTIYLDFTWGLEEDPRDRDLPHFGQI